MDCGLDNMARWTAVTELQGQLGRWPTGRALVNHIQGQNRLSAASIRPCQSRLFAASVQPPQSRLESLLGHAAAK